MLSLRVWGKPLAGSTCTSCYDSTEREMQMLQLLILLAGLQYGSDVRALGHPEFAVRDAAFRRLEAAGWLAAPALSDVQVLPARGFPHTLTDESTVNGGRYRYSTVPRPECRRPADAPTRGNRSSTHT